MGFELENTNDFLVKSGKSVNVVIKVQKKSFITMRITRPNLDIKTPCGHKKSTDLKTYS
jgi:hypothetical protein